MYVYTVPVYTSCYIEGVKKSSTFFKRVLLSFYVSYNPGSPIIQKVFILQGWLIPFWITNFIVVKIRCEPGLYVANIKNEQYELEKS